MMLAKYHWSHRTFLFIIDKLGLNISEEDKYKISHGGNPVEAIYAQLTSADDNFSIQKYIQQVELSGSLEEAQNTLDFLSNKFEEETGLWAYLNVGDPTKQDRSAAATRSRNEHANSRINDMQGCIQEFFSKVGRKESLTAMYHMSPEDIAAVLGGPAGEIWGRLMATEQLSVDYWKGEFTAGGMDPIDAEAMAIQTLDGAITLEEWANETDLQIEVGSTRRKTPEEEEAAGAEMANQFPAVLADMGMPAAAAQIAAKRMEDMGAPPDVVQMVKDQGNQKQAVADANDQLNLQAAQMQVQQMMQPQPMGPPHQA